MKLMKKMMTATCITPALFFPAANAQTVTKPAADVTAEQVFELSSAQDAGTNGGGPWVAEKDAIWQRGEISAIEVCHGTHVDSITPIYAGVRGTKFGGNGGGCEIWTLPKTGYLKSIYIWSGRYMDAIQFHMSEGKPSKIFSEGGGRRTILEDRNGAAIRKIDGKWGVYLDRVRVHFGLPYYIDNVKFDYDALKKQMDVTKPEQIDLQFVSACRSSSSVSQKIEISKKVKEMHSFKFSNTTALNIKTYVEGGFGPIVKAGVETSVNTAFTVEKANGFETESNYVRTINATAQPGTKIHVTTTSKKANLDLPYTYDLIHYKNGNKKDVVRAQNFNGVYKGNKTASTETEQIDYDCETDQPLDEIAADDEYDVQ